MYNEGQNYICKLGSFINRIVLLKYDDSKIPGIVEKIRKEPRFLLGTYLLWKESEFLWNFEAISTNALKNQNALNCSVSIELSFKQREKVVKSAHTAKWILNNPIYIN